MGGSIDSMTEREDRVFRERMGMVDPKDYGIDVDAIDQEIDAKLAKVKQPKADIRALIQERPNLFDSPDSSVPGERAEELERRGLGKGVVDGWIRDAKLRTRSRDRKGDFGK